MELNFNQKYQSQNFCGSKFNMHNLRGLRNKVLNALGITTVGTGTYILNKDNGMSSEEMNGRVLLINGAKNSESDLFNQEVSFNYFANGKLKDVPEYIENGKQAISELSDDDKINYSNTLKYQEQIVDKILSEDALINNNSIRNGLYKLVNKGYNLPDTNWTDWENYPEIIMNSQLQILDMYVNDTDMQQNEYINGNLCNYVMGCNHWFPSICEKVANVTMQLLKDNANNTDEEFFDKLQDCILGRVPPELTLKTLSNKNLYKNEALFEVVQNVSDSYVAGDIVKILDCYEQSYSDSELVSENIGNIILEVMDNALCTYSAYGKKSVERAAKMMQDMAEKEKPSNTEIKNK